MAWHPQGQTIAAAQVSPSSDSTYSALLSIISGKSSSTSMILKRGRTTSRAQWISFLMKLAMLHPARKLRQSKQRVPISQTDPSLRDWASRTVLFMQDGHVSQIQLQVLVGAVG